jgi:hypothetical protein
MKVFLGGTVNGSNWRDSVKEELTIDYFDPVVKEWDDAAYQRELSERRYCNYVLYVLTPKFTGYYAIAEVTDDSYHRPDRTIYCYLPKDGNDKFSDEEIVEFENLGKVVTDNGGTWLKTLDEIIVFLNSPNSIQPTTENDEHYDAFVSFGRQESQFFARNVLNRLTELRMNIFADFGDIPLIIENEDFVYRKILRSDNFIYVISPNSVRSEYCKKELEFAIKFNKRIIPVLHKKLGRDIQFLDNIIANKNILELERKKSDEHIPELIARLVEVVNTDREYVHKHSELLFKARDWDFAGRQQSDLLYGVERKKAINWLRSESKSLVPLQIQRSYIEASIKLSPLMMPLLWLHEKTKSLTYLPWFDKATLAISLANPIALSDQLRTLVFSENPARFETTSIPMWVLFLIIDIALAFVGIKSKNLALFVSMVLSVIICTSVIMLVLLNR